MIFEPGHEYSLVTSPERNEREAVNVLYACVKSSTSNPSAAIPALAEEDCPDSQWLSAHESRGQQANNPSAAIPALAAKDCPDSHWLSARESRGQQANNPSAAIPALADKNCPDSKWLSVNNSRGQQAKENKKADSISLSRSFGIRGQHNTTDLQRKSKEIHGETTESTSADSIRLSKLFGIRGQQATSYRGQNDSSANFKSTLFYSPANKGATSFNRSNYFNIQSITWMPCREGDNHHSHLSAKIVASFQCFVACSLLSNEGDERCQCIVASALTIFTFDNEAAEHIVHPSASEGASTAEISVFPRPQQLERRTHQPPEPQAERHAQEPPEKYSTLSSRRWNIVVSPSMPMTAESNAATIAYKLQPSNPKGRTSSEGAFVTFLSHPEYYCVDPQSSATEGEIFEFISALQNDRAFCTAAPTHPVKIVALAIASEGEQRPQMIVISYPMSMLIVESILASRSEGESISTSRSEGEISQLIVEFISLSRNEGEHRIDSVNDIRRKPHKKPPDKFSDGLRTNCNSITSASEGGNFDMVRSISPAHYMPSTSESARNRLISSLVRGTAIKMAGQEQLTVELAITSVVWQYNVNDTGCQQSWQRISQLLATTEATAASTATQPFLSKLFVATLATAFATASAALVSVSIMQLAILSRLRQQRRSLSLWPHHNGFYVKPLTSAAYSDLLASILASKISVTYLLWRLSIERVTYLLCNLHQYLRKTDIFEQPKLGFLRVSFPRECENKFHSQDSAQSNFKLTFLAEGFFKLFSTK